VRAGGRVRVYEPTFMPPPLFLQNFSTVLHLFHQKHCITTNVLQFNFSWSGFIWIQPTLKFNATLQETNLPATFFVWMRVGKGFGEIVSYK